eukprot:c15512_g1_i1.p2 GENE.c15512_g1_i1~~c15512_g1_i1.p2  ORF type:complete len:153 (+),score=26.23 c15512_g1_i1:216-674(+)
MSKTPDHIRRAGQERFREITTSYYRNASGILLVYDVSDTRSFDDVSLHWMPAIRTHAPENVSVSLVGNKADLPHRVITTQQGAQLADEHGWPFLEASALTGSNVEEAFSTLARNCVLQIGPSPPRTRPPTIALIPTEPPKQRHQSCACLSNK